MAFGLFLVVWGAATRLEHSRLEKEGVVAEGTVTGKRWSRSTGYVNYAFFTRDNRFIEGGDRWGGGEWMKLQLGGPVTVAYVASRPATNRILPLTPDDRLPAGLVIVGAGLVLLLMAAFRWPRRLFAPKQ